ncbi:unnamed protein product, partial [Didymodactylos carnosus]
VLVPCPCSSCTSTLSTTNKNCRNHHHNSNDCPTLITTKCSCHCRPRMDTLSSSPHYNLLGNGNNDGHSNSNSTILMTTIAENGSSTMSSQRNKKRGRTTTTTTMIDKTQHKYIDHSLSSDSQSNSDNNIRHEQNDINHENEKRLIDRGGSTTMNLNIPLPPNIPLDHSTLLTQLKTAQHHSTFLCDNSSQNYQTPPPIPPPPPPPLPSASAYLIQTQSGNAILIPQSALMPSNSQGTFPLRSSGYALTSAYPLVSQHQQPLLSTNDRLKSNSSNLYQTIDAESHREYVTQSEKSETFPDTPLLAGNCYVYPVEQSTSPRCNCDSTTYNEQTTTTRQSTHSPCPLFGNTTCKTKKVLRHRLTWKCTAIIFMLLTLCFFSSMIYLSVLKWYYGKYHPTFRENDLNANSISADVKSLHGTSPMFIRIGDTIKRFLEPQTIIQIQFYIDKTTIIRYNLTASKTATLGVYCQKSKAPTLTRFDFFHIFDGSKQTTTRIKRSSTINSSISLVSHTYDRLTVSFNQHMNEGLWYLTVLNDGYNREEFILITEQNNQSCPKSCTNHGTCIKGVCNCHTGYTGDDCSLGQCSTLCNGHGVIERGRCFCYDGYHGSECELSANQCETPNCNKHGTCVNGVCLCDTGFTGTSCEYETCLQANCSGNGYCIKRRCRCYQGFTGDACETGIIDKCDNDCSKRENQLSNVICSVDCGQHGKCFNGTCQCDNGWIGNQCTEQTCNVNCGNGRCQNGTCICLSGFQGRFYMCANNCNGHGECRKENNRYSCICQSNWLGLACELTRELNCNDRIDNDNDGLIDCLDPDCCSSSHCSATQECITKTNAKDILLRRQATSLTATFFERMQFLIQEDGLQTSSIYSSFNERRASVIRGQIFYKTVSPLNGVKVQISNSPSLGYTISNKEGFFNLLVNGGGSILLDFTRQPFKSKQLSIFVPWNKFVHIGYIYMDENDNNENGISKHINSTCLAIYNNFIEPKIWETNSYRTFINNNNGYSYTLGSQILRQYVSIPETQMNLVYISTSSTKKYYSIITIVLTSNSIHSDLETIHLQISIEGTYFYEIFDAQPDLVYEYEWNRRNAYDQNVYGLTYASGNLIIY